MSPAAPSGVLNQRAQYLIDKFRSRKAVVGIVGLGYVGLPLILRFADAGFRTLGFDIDAEKISALSSARSYIKTISAERVARATERGLQATTDYARAREADALIVCVPTPLSRSREPDLSYVLGTVESLCPHLHAAQLL